MHVNRLPATNDVLDELLDAAAAVQDMYDSMGSGGLEHAALVKVWSTAQCTSATRGRMRWRCWRTQTRTPARWHPCWTLRAARRCSCWSTRLYSVRPLSPAAPPTARRLPAAAIRIAAGGADPARRAVSPAAAAARRARGGPAQRRQRRECISAQEFLAAWPIRRWKSRPDRRSCAGRRRAMSLSRNLSARCARRRWCR